MFDEKKSCPIFQDKIFGALRILNPPMETPDPPNDTPGASKQVVLTPQDIPYGFLGSVKISNFYGIFDAHLPGCLHGRERILELWESKIP